MPLTSVLYFLTKTLPIAVLVCVLTSQWAQSAHTDPGTEATAVQVVRTLAVVAPAAQTIEAVQAAPSADWQTFNPHATYPIKEGVALWVQLTLFVSTPPNGWSIKLPKPYLDRIELHLPASGGAWTVQAAGDKVAHSAWPVRSLHPKFMLPVLPVGEHKLFLKISNTVPFSVALQLHNPQSALNDSFDHLIRSAGIVILIICMAFISACMAGVYRDKAYAWNSAYALSAALTAAAYTGLASYVLWSETVFWPERSIHVTLLMSIVLQIIFCYETFEPQKLWPRFTGLMWFSIALTAAGIALLMTVQHIWVYTVGLIVPMLINWFIVVSMVVVRLRQGELSAKMWMLAYLPLALLVIAAVLEGFGLLPVAVVGYYWPMYALAFEVPVLLLALMLRAKSRDAQAVTRRTRQQLDPLTGFILPRAYEGVAAPMWQKAASVESDLAVVYVQITQPSLPYLSGRSHVPGGERVVRVLRTVFRMDDTFAQVRDDVYAVLMPGKTLGEPLQSRLTRAVAQLHMLSIELKTDYPLRTRIAACTNQTLPMPWPEVHRILLSKFDEEEKWDKRAIRIVSKRHSQRADDADLSNFWARAVEAEAESNRSSAP
jgi:two-component system, sensor histidine kinase LadS